MNIPVKSLSRLKKVLQPAHQLFSCKLCCELKENIQTQTYKNIYNLRLNHNHLNSRHFCGISQENNVEKTVKIEDTESHSGKVISNQNEASSVVKDAHVAMETHSDLDPPPASPTTCCMSGCVSCVWIQYAEDMVKYYKDADDKIRTEIDKIEDENMKMFIKMELGLL